MSRFEAMTPTGTRPRADQAAAHCPCQRRDLARWSEHGGPLPYRLAAHITDCPACAEQVRRVNRVFASLSLLQTQPIPSNTMARANGRALRMMRRAARASKAAARLLRMRPNLTRWQRAQVHLARASLSAAAAVVVLMTRAGLFAGMEEARVKGQELASLHWERHIDPNGEWMGPRPMA